MLRAVLAAVILLVFPFAAQAQDEHAPRQERVASVVERKVLAGMVIVVHGSWERAR